jgi:hypothetical protein
MLLTPAPLLTHGQQQRRVRSRAQRPIVAAAAPVTAPSARTAPTHAAQRQALVSLALAALISSAPEVLAAAADQKCLAACIKECNAIAPGSPEYCNDNCKDECDPNKAAADTASE